MKKILVPTDFSEEAKQAAEVACIIAKNYNCEVVFTHMLNLPVTISNGTTTSGSVMNNQDMPEALFFMKLAKQNFDKFLDNDFIDGVTYKETIDFHDVTQGIVETCDKEDIDLIVMGSHGADGLKEMFIGSTAEKVVRTSKRPVMVIKNKHKDFNVKQFVFASDFKNDSKETYQQAVRLAEIFDAKIHLLMVITPGNFTSTAKARARVLDFIKDSSFENYTINIFNDGSVEEGILNFASINDADLIGISTHGRQGIAHFFNGSISEDLVNHAKRPVITFKI